MKRLRIICRNKGMKIDDRSLDMLIDSMGNDMRQLLNYLQMISKSNKSVGHNQVSQR